MSHSLPFCDPSLTMTRILAFSVALCMSFSSFCQGVPQVQRFPHIQLLDASPISALAWLQQSTKWPSEAYSWEPAFSKESPGGYHYHFHAVAYGLPLQGAEAVVFIDRSNTLQGAQWATCSALPAPPTGANAAVWHEGNWHWVMLTEEHLQDPYRWEQVTRDAQFGTELQRRDLLLHFTDSVGRTTVFKPDPLVVAGVTYGGNYVDANDQNTTILDPLRDTVSLTLTYNAGLFTLANDAAVIQEFDGPIVAIPNSASSDFFYSRSDAGFEMVNALYHIETIYQRLRSLGFGSLMNYAIPMDVNAFNGQDNSAFDRSTNPPRLLFGEGGVDDAEDSDVIAHEYGHALLHAAAPFTVNGTERACLEEAICDYFAMSHSYRWDPWRFMFIFNWDGHNEFWSGRMGTSTKDYSNLSFTSLYSHTDVFADPLAMGLLSLGPDVMDRILLEAMFNFSSYMTMPQAAHWILAADTALYSGQHASTLHLHFAARNILTPEIGLEEEMAKFFHNGLVLPQTAPWPWPNEDGALFALDGRCVKVWRQDEERMLTDIQEGSYICVLQNGQRIRLTVVSGG